jgi:hypothetical protein
MSSALRLLAITLLVLPAVGGCALGGRSWGGYFDDKALTGAVKTRLAFAVPKSLTHVNVDAFEGTVYLTGEVDTPQQKSDAEIAAWKIQDVQQVVNDLRVRGKRAVSASPPIADVPAPLQERLPGIVRLDPASPGGPALAYDGSGALVATVYVRSLREVVTNGIDSIDAPVKPIDHVSIYPVLPGGAQPEALVQIVLWHVSRAAAAALR